PCHCGSSQGYSRCARAAHSPDERSALLPVHARPPAWSAVVANHVRREYPLDQYNLSAVRPRERRVSCCHWPSLAPLVSRKRITSYTVNCTPSQRCKDAIFLSRSCVPPWAISTVRIAMK